MRAWVTTKVVSGISGLDLQYVPTEQPTTWASVVLSMAANVVGGSIPPMIAPMMNLVIDEAMLAITDTEDFLTQDPWDLGKDLANTAIDT